MRTTSVLTGAVFDSVTALCALPCAALQSLAPAAGAQEQARAPGKGCGKRH